MLIENQENDLKYYNGSQISKEEYLKLKNKDKDKKVLVEDYFKNNDIIIQEVNSDSKIQYFSE